MKLVIRAATDNDAQLERDALACLRDEFGDSARVRLQRVFPAGTPGRRGRLFLAESDLAIDDDAVRRLIDRLMALDSIEAAGPEAPKHPV